MKLFQNTFARIIIFIIFGSILFSLLLITIEVMAMTFPDIKLAILISILRFAPYYFVLLLSLNWLLISLIHGLFIGLFFEVVYRWIQKKNLNN
jgi:hypothetical protein